VWPERGRSRPQAPAVKRVRSERAQSAGVVRPGRVVTRAVSATGSDQGRPGRTGPPGGASDHGHSRVGLRSVRVSRATEHLHDGVEVRRTRHRPRCWDRRWCQTGGSESGGLIEPLSERELDVLRLLGSDLSGPDIARELLVSINTMRHHTKSIYPKLGVNNRRAAVRRAQELDLLSQSRRR
jgi:DNA-binding CsgD family transcriptional regulator